MLEAYDAFEHICRTAFESKDRGYVALVVDVRNDWYEAYFDAAFTSVPKRDFPVHTVGVYLAKQSDWKKFRKEWCRELRGVPYFHMTDFERDFLATKKGDRVSCKSPYFGLKEDEYLPLLKRVHKTIAQTNANGEIRIKGFASHLVKSAFDALRPPELANDPYCASYYIFNVVVLMKEIYSWMVENEINEPVHYIFAGGDKQGNYIDALFSDLWEDPDRARRFHLSKGITRTGYGLAWMKDEPAIQAADIGCYELHKIMLLWIEMGYPDEIPVAVRRKSLSALASMGMKHKAYAYRGEHLRNQFNLRLQELSGY